MFVDFNQLCAQCKITYIFKTLAICIALVGIPFNLITFIIFKRKRFDNYTFSFYIRVTCLVDSIVLAHSFRHWAAYALDANIDLIDNFLCKTSEFALLFVNASVSVWLRSFIALDRFLSIAFPYRFSFIRKRSFRMAAIVAIYLLSFLLYTPVPVLSNLMVETTYDNESNNSNESTSTCRMSESGDEIVYWINIGNLMFSTLVVNNILTVVLIVFIFRLSKQKLLAKDQQARRMARDRKFAINSIVLNVICLASKTPFLIGSLMIAYIPFSPLTSEMIDTIGEGVFLVDNASSFFTSISFNRLFFEEFCKTLGSKKFETDSTTRSVNNMSKK